MADQDGNDGGGVGGYRREETLSEISEEHHDGGNDPLRPGRNPDTSEEVDNYGDYEQLNEDGAATSADRYLDRADGNSQPHPQDEDYYELQQHGGEAEEGVAHFHYQEQQTMTTDKEDWGEQKPDAYEAGGDYQQDGYRDAPMPAYTPSGYESPPDAAESVVSDEHGDDFTMSTTSSSQKYVAMAAKLAGEEGPSESRGQSNEQEDAIEGISDGSDEETTHSQAKAYRTRQAQVDRIGRKSKVSGLINRFESS